MFDSIHIFHVGDIIIDITCSETNNKWHFQLCHNLNFNASFLCKKLKQGIWNDARIQLLKNMNLKYSWTYE